MAVWVPYWELDCEKCSDSQKEFYGCEQDSPVPEQWHIRDYSWQRCPVKLITQQTAELMRAYSLMQTGITPHNSGWLRESNKLMEAMQLISIEVARRDKKMMREARAKSER